MTEKGKKKRRQKQDYDSKFLIQIPNRVIRAKELDDVTFFVYCKLIQIYWMKFGKKNPLEIDHSALKYHTGIKTNEKLKQCLVKLYECKLIKTNINETLKNKKGIAELPKDSPIYIELNTFFDKEKLEEINKTRTKKGKKEKKYYFAQLPCELLDVRVLRLLKYTGIRLLYYYQSYMKHTKTEPFAFPSFLTIEKEIGITDNTIKKYNDILSKFKLIKVVKNRKKDSSYDYNDDFSHVKRFNNHYYVMSDHIVVLLNKLKNEEKAL